MNITASPGIGFTDEEFATRTVRAQRLMQESGMDILMFCTEPEVRYFSGFHTQFWQSPTRPWFLLLSKKGRPVAVIPEIGRECMERTWVEDIRCWPAPCPKDDGITLLRGAIQELAGDAACIGLPMGHESQLRMSLRDFERLRDSLKPARFVDATPLISSLRMVKSEAEIEKISTVCTMVSAAFEALPGLLLPGLTEREIFRLFKLECFRQGVDEVSYLVGGASEGGYRDIISPPGNNPVVEGDVLILDTGCLFEGYFCDFDRNFAFGRVDSSAKSAYSTVYRATEAGLEAARPGVTCAEVFRAMNRVLIEGGARNSSVGRLGHGLGMQLTEWPSIAAFDHTRLAPGMVITMEPGMSYADGRLMVHEENIVIREHGAELLTHRAPEEMPVVQGSVVS